LLTEIGDIIAIPQYYSRMYHVNEECVIRNFYKEENYSCVFYILFLCMRMRVTSKNIYMFD